VKIDLLIEQLHQTMRTLEQRFGPGDPAAGQHRRVDRAHAGDRGRDAFPVRNRLGVHGCQRDVSAAEVAMASAVRSASSPSSFAEPAATDIASCSA